MLRNTIGVGATKIRTHLVRRCTGAGIPITKSIVTTTTHSTIPVFITADELLQLEDAHNQGRESLYTELSKEPSKALVQFAGFPTASEAQTLFQALQQTC